MRLSTACVARALLRCMSRIGVYVLLTLQAGMPISTTRHQLRLTLLVNNVVIISSCANFPFFWRWQADVGNIRLNLLYLLQQFP